MNWETILCLGDSITIGSRSYLGYPEYCGETLSILTKKSWNVVSHAVAGYRAIDLVRSMDANFSSLKNTKPELISILIGTNDTKNSTNAEDFRITYEQLLIKARLIGGSSNIIVIDVPELMPGVMLPYKLNHNSAIKEYNSIISELVKKYKLMQFKFEQSPSLFYDGVHLNNKGSKAWGEQLAQYINDLRS